MTQLLNTDTNFWGLPKKWLFQKWRRPFVLHVNKHVILHNEKHNYAKPPLIVRQGKDRDYAHVVAIADDTGRLLGRLGYNRRKPLNCGAKVWLELHPSLHVTPVLLAGEDLREIVLDDTCLDQ